MAYELNWSLIGEPMAARTGAMVQAGFERGATQSALSQLATDPTNESALARLAMFQPEAALHYRDRARQETLRSGLRSAFDPATGQIDAAAARRAYANAGDIPGAIEFDQNRATAQRTQQTVDMDRARRMADLLDDSTDPESYARNRATAIQLRLGDEATIPPTYDPAWVAQQRHIVGVLSDRRQLTTHMQDYLATGGNFDTPEGRAGFGRFLQQNAAPRIIMVNGQPMLVGGGGGEATEPPAELTDEQVQALEQGGPAPAAGPGTFPQ